MRVGDEVSGQLATKFAVLLPQLNERQQRLALPWEPRRHRHADKLIPYRSTTRPT